jgi:orotidine-5'-phosphate decarboxylase
MDHSFGQAHEHCPLGLVVGAGRSDVLDRPDLIASGLPLLCPGLGPQGADWTDARRRLHASKTNSTLYPLSRFVFGGGQWPPERALHNLNMALEQLGGPSGSAPNKGHCS